eukprot:1187341-Prorocentrum_minimum.AAC.5
MLERRRESFAATEPCCRPASCLALNSFRPERCTHHQAQRHRRRHPRGKAKGTGAKGTRRGRGEDQGSTFKLTMKTLSSRLTTRKSDSPANSLRMAYVRVKP